MIRSILCCAVAFGVGGVASAGELDKDVMPAKAGITAGPLKASATELDKESPTDAWYQRGGWGGHHHHHHHGYANFGYSNYGYGNYGNYGNYGYGYSGGYNPYVYRPSYYSGYGGYGGYSSYGGFGYGYRSAYIGYGYGGW